jgi:hypothetical protein
LAQPVQLGSLSMFAAPVCREDDTPDWSPE